MWDVVERSREFKKQSLLTNPPRIVVLVHWICSKLSSGLTANLPDKVRVSERKMCKDCLLLPEILCLAERLEPGAFSPAHG